MWWLNSNMVHIVEKKINGKQYLYLVATIRKGQKTIQKHIKYIGKKRPVPAEEFDCMQFSVLEEDWILTKLQDRLSYQDHVELKKASKMQKEFVKQLNQDSKKDYFERFLCRFISNSNSLEGSTLTFKDTYDYLFNDILPKGKSKKELYMVDNLFKAWEYVEKNHKKFPKESDLFELHRLVNKNIEEDKTLGEYKKVQNYMGDKYTSSFLFVNEKMNKLFKWFKKAFREINDFEVAFQSHAQFELIHPFQDGNGRVGRLLLNWLLMYKGYAPLSIQFKKRQDYLISLQNAQKGKIEAISKFCYEQYLLEHDFIKPKS